MLWKQTNKELYCLTSICKGNKKKIQNFTIILIISKTSSLRLHIFIKIKPTFLTHAGFAGLALKWLIMSVWSQTRLHTSLNVNKCWLICDKWNQQKDHFMIA